jgi:hypothetical protein
MNHEISGYDDSDALNIRSTFTPRLEACILCFKRLDDGHRHVDVSWLVLRFGIIDDWNVRARSRKKIDLGRGPPDPFVELLKCLIDSVLDGRGGGR